MSWTDCLDANVPSLVLRLSALAHHVERLLGHADGPHGVVDPAATESGLGNGECLSLATEETFGGHPHVVVVDEGVHALALVLAHQSNVTDELDPLGVGRHQEHRHAVVDVGLGVSQRHDDQEGRRAGVGREVLPAVDDPFFAVLGGGGLKEGRVRTPLGLGHRIAREDLPGEQRHQVPLLLFLGAVVGDNFRIAGVGGLGPKDLRAPGRTAEDLVHQGELHLAVALAAELGTEVTGPQSSLAHLGLQGVDDGTQIVIDRMECLMAEGQVERFDFFAYESVHPIELFLERGVG